MEKNKCFFCNVPLNEVKSKYKGMEFDSLQCPKCKRKVLTEELMDKAVIIVKQQRLKEEYTRNPIKIGHSWGITFPKDIAEVFNLGNSKTKLQIKTDLQKKKIELVVV